MGSSASNWTERAECLGKPVDYFFEGYEARPQFAAEIDELCSHCPVRQECLRDAIDTDSISTTGVRAGIYFVLGKVSKTKNSHKSPEDFARAVKEVDEIRKAIKDGS